MDTVNMQKKPEIVVFAGPNGFGKSIVTKVAKVISPYINADDIKNCLHCSDLEAAQKSTELREKCVGNLEGFTFETVLSTRRNLELLPELIQVCDVCHIYDNSLETASRIFKKRKSEYFFWENVLWSKENIEKLTGVMQS